MATRRNLLLPLLCTFFGLFPTAAEDLEVNGVTCWRNESVTDCDGLNVSNHYFKQKRRGKGQSLHLDKLAFTLHVPFEPYENTSYNSRR